jgi:hypothetical protein
MLIYLSTTPKETTTVESEITIPLPQTLPPAMIPKQTVTQIPSMIANLKNLYFGKEIADDIKDDYSCKSEIHF